MLTTFSPVDMLADNGNPRLPVDISEVGVMFQLYEFDTLAWNKIVVGLATSEDLRSSSTLSMQPQLVDRLCIHTELISATQISIPPAVLYGRYGLAGECYRDTPILVTYPRARDLIISLFIRRVIPVAFKPPPLANMNVQIEQY